MTQKPLTLTDILEEFRKEFVNTEGFVGSGYTKSEWIEHFLETSLRKVLEEIKPKEPNEIIDQFDLGYKRCIGKLEQNTTNFFNKKI